MKNEEKILELLSEYIARSDRFEQEFKKELIASRKRYEVHDQKFEASQKRFEDHDRKFESNQKEIIELRRDLKKSFVQQDAILQEIFSISKRVGKLEGNQ